MTIETPNAITDNGWYFYSKCTCGGILKHKFRHTNKPGLELHWYVRKDNFLIKSYNTIKVQLTPISNLQQILNDV